MDCNSTETLPYIWDEGIVTEESTCTVAGTSLHTCTLEGCGATYEETLELADHELETVPAKEATYTEIGWKEFKRCINCDYSEGFEQIPILKAAEITTYDDFIIAMDRLLVL